MPRSAPLAPFILLLAALCMPSFNRAQSNAAPSESGPDAEVKEFRLGDLEVSLRTMKPGPDHDYFAGILANRDGHIADSIRLLNTAIPGIRTPHPERAALALQALADDYNKTFQYADASKAYEDLLTHFATQLSPEDLKSTKDDAGIAKILRDAPPQTITWNGPVKLKTERNRLNSQNVDLTVNGVAVRAVGSWITGAASLRSQQKLCWEASRAEASARFRQHPSGSHRNRESRARGVASYSRSRRRNPAQRRGHGVRR